jgi:hypothetical protein
VNRFHRHYCASRAWARLVRLTAIEIEPALARATRARVPAAHVVQGDATTLGGRLHAAGFEQARIRTGSRIVFHAYRPG